jgi:hypothetical protein
VISAATGEDAKVSWRPLHEAGASCPGDHAWASSGLAASASGARLGVRSGSNSVIGLSGAGHYPYYGR